MLENNRITRDWYRLKLYSPRLAQACPGQFVHLRLGKKEDSDPLLRRPFSIHYMDRQSAEIWLAVRETGRGTAKIAHMQRGEMLDLIGPCGNGFRNWDEPGPVLMVAGGIGLAPLFALAVNRKISGLPGELLAGGKSADFLPPDSYFTVKGLEAAIATEDGSRGYRGLVTGLLQEYLERRTAVARVFACGPVRMLARVVELCDKYNVPCQISLESHLACAVGACLGCVIPCKDAAGKIEYRRVCKDGPVFNGEEVCFDH